MVNHPEHKTKMTRLSVSIPDDHWQQLQFRAKKQKVSLAWLVRNAIDEYMNKDIPLLAAAYHYSWTQKVLTK
jgi:predicted HicB family RNase H-like nuclease